MRRRVIVIGATVAVFVAVLALARASTSAEMSLLYANLDNTASGEVIMALDQRGARYEVRGTSIFVPADQRDRLRMTLATEGLPANTTQGYEILDNLSGFGTTSQMFDAAYWRAKEGELARTMLASPHIKSARVHISSPTAQPFRRDQKPTAAVTVATILGRLDAGQADALRFLVASSVPGMLPEDVAVIDGAKGLVQGGQDPAAPGAQDDRAGEIRARVERLLAARVGPGNAVVEVSVDAVTDSESITERRFDPDSRFIISSDSEERSDQSENAGAGAVTVASNLPDGDANASEKETRQSSETRERLNYEVSQTTREIIRAPGAIKRLTVAVLVNGQVQAQPDGTQAFVPMPEAELTALRDLVASAVGYDESRGDVITLKSLSFEPMEQLGSSPTDPGWFSGALDTMTLVQIAVLALVVLVLGLFVVRPLLLPSRRFAELAAPGTGRLGVEGADLPVLSGTIEPDETGSGLPALADATFRGSPDNPEDAVTRLRTLIEERRGETVEVLRSWLEEPKAGDAS